VPGKPLESGAVGVVRASKSQRFKEAEVVTGLLPWATHLVLDDKQQVREGDTALASWQCVCSHVSCLPRFSFKMQLG
jgi:NADPH-dependent curcumin reductase CurA